MALVYESRSSWGAQQDKLNMPDLKPLTYVDPDRGRNWRRQHSPISVSLLLRTTNSASKQGLRPTRCMKLMSADLAGGVGRRKAEGRIRGPKEAAPCEAETATWRSETCRVQT